MNFTIYNADCKGDATNVLYPHKKNITAKADLTSVVKYDQVFAQYKDNYRNRDNFMNADVIPMDVDNDHSENPAEWVSIEKFTEMFSDVDHIIIPSRHNMLVKKGKSARPRYHVLFPVHVYKNEAEYTAIKNIIQQKYIIFDDNAVDSARFFFGSAITENDLVWHEGFLQIDETIDEVDYTEEVIDETKDEIPFSDSILEGTRNKTMSHFAGRVLKKFGICEKAHDIFLERAENCQPPLSESELSSIWKSAVKFARKITTSEGYISPEEYNSDFGVSRLKPEDYSDIGEAKVLADECSRKLKYTSGTDYLSFGGDRWYEDKQKALGIVEEFMDNQLSDAYEAIVAADEALIAIGIDRDVVKGHGKELEKAVPNDKIELLHALIGALAYQKFVMKYRNYKNIVNTMNAAKPMLAIDVSELDHDAEYLNTPEGTYNLKKGIDSIHPHDPDDLITKIAACGPGEKGMALWTDALNTFFCGDRDLISYVQQIVGIAAVGKVYAEQMIIAYGGGANGKSTFWNSIARVLGNYSGKISAEALTINCRRNVKPEMAELKGKRLIIASELEEGTRLNTAMVKQLCSTDPIEAEKKYKDPFFFEPSHMLVLYTNHLPKVSANDDGTWRRLIVIPFNARITGKSDIKNYSDYLFENAGPAIMKWIIEGAEQAIAMNFKILEPQVVKDAVAKYREDNDWLGHFIDEHCDVHPTYTEKSGELYQVYRSTCLLSGEFVRSTADFYGSLEKAGFFRHRTKSGKMVIGLRLKDAQDFLE